MFLRQSTDHEETEQAAWRFIELWRVGDTTVELDEVSFGDTETRIGDFDLHTVNGLVTRDRHRGGGIGEVGRVVE